MSLSAAVRPVTRTGRLTFGLVYGRCKSGTAALSCGEG